MDNLSQLKDGILKALQLEYAEGALAVPYCNILAWLKANGYSADCFVNRLQVVRALDELAREKRIVRPNRGRSAWRLSSSTAKSIEWR